jgi:hypothetical protein
VRFRFDVQSFTGQMPPVATGQALNPNEATGMRGSSPSPSIQNSPSQSTAASGPAHLVPPAHSVYPGRPKGALVRGSVRNRLKTSTHRPTHRPGPGDCDQMALELGPGLFVSGAHYQGKAPGRMLQRPNDQERDYVTGATRAVVTGCDGALAGSPGLPIGRRFLAAFRTEVHCSSPASHREGSAVSCSS